MLPPQPIAEIRLAEPGHIPALARIEREAARLLEGRAPAELLERTKDPRELGEAQAHGRLWVALVGGVPVGFALVEMLAPELPHLEEMDVDPRHGRKGIGTAMLKTVCAWATRLGYAQLTLTTFRDVPWNMPFYARNGFAELPPHGLRPEVAAVVRNETARGLDPRTRVVMGYRI